MRYIFLAFALYFTYRFIADFLIPVIRTTRQVKKQFDAVKERQQTHFSQQTEPEMKRKPAVPDEDYIEFEEIKS